MNHYSQFLAIGCGKCLVWANLAVVSHNGIVFRRRTDPVTAEERERESSFYVNWWASTVDTCDQGPFTLHFFLGLHSPRPIYIAFCIRLNSPLICKLFCLTKLCIQHGLPMFQILSLNLPKMSD